MTEPSSPPRRARVLAPDDRLKRRIGNATQRLRAHETAAQVGDAAAKLDPHARADIEAQLQLIERLARDREGDISQKIFLAAHWIRSIAGSFRMDRLGRIADCICRYVTSCSEAAPDANTLTLLVIAARQTNGQARDEDNLADELVEECEALLAHLLQPG